MESPTSGTLNEVKHVFAITEGKEHRSDGAHLHTEVAEKQRHVGDARQLEQDGANVLRTGWGLDAHQLFGSQNERHLVGETAQPVDAVDERSHLRISANLGELFVSAMHVATRWLGPHHLLAVETGNDTQGAVRGRVLRPNVERHTLGFKFNIEA